MQVRVVFGEQLPVRAAGRERAASGIAYGHDGPRRSCSCCASSTECHYLGAWASDEVEEVDRDVDVDVLVADGSIIGVQLAATA